jgi:hypothetical protein
MKAAVETYIAVGPQMQHGAGAKYGVVPAARNFPRNSPPYIRFQPVLLYPVAYY